MRDWHERLVAQTIEFGTRNDPDLAAHFVITRTRGVSLFGAPINVVFGDVPVADYWASIKSDAADILDNITFNPVYSILNLCRVLAYKQAKLIMSKVEGAAWAFEHLPTQFHRLITQALDIYQSPIATPIQWNEPELIAFGTHAQTVLFG